MKQPVRISRSDDGVVLTVVAEGDYSLAEVKSSLEAAVAESSPGRDCCLMMDLRRSEAHPSSDQLRDFAVFLGDLPAHLVRRAAWIVSADLRYGLARMLSAFAEEQGLTIKVFRDTDEAERWLVEGHDADHAGDRIDRNGAS